jgi:hypothetical protein
MLAEDMLRGIDGADGTVCVEERSLDDMRKHRVSHRYSIADVHGSYNVSCCRMTEPTGRLGA